MLGASTPAEAPGIGRDGSKIVIMVQVSVIPSIEIRCRSTQFTGQKDYATNLLVRTSLSKYPLGEFLAECYRSLYTQGRQGVIFSQQTLIYSD